MIETVNLITLCAALILGAAILAVIYAPVALRSALIWAIKRKAITFYDLSIYSNWELFKIWLDV